MTKSSKKKRKRKNKSRNSRRRKRRLKKKVIKFLIIFASIIVLLLLLFVCYKLFFKRGSKKKTPKIDYALIAKENYHDKVNTLDDVKIYDKKKKEVGKISKDSTLVLDGVDGVYYKIKDTVFYVKYDNLEEDKSEYEYSNIKSEYETFKNYIPFNMNIITKEHASLYQKDKEVIKLDMAVSLPIYIKLADKYGIELNGSLYYINKSDVEGEVASNNSSLPVAKKLPVLNYHYTVNREAGETKECLQDICTTDTQVEEEIKYLSDNNYYSTSMKDTYLYLSGAIQLPAHSVAITIDDGWYVGRMIGILDKYKMLGTLFLIGSLSPIEAYKSEYLEIHSHSWNMHNIGDCPGKLGGAITCFGRDSILADLKQSRDSLNGTTVFCFPFYEYNERAINLLKEAGFEMAFIGGERSATPGSDLFKIPRYVIVNTTSMNEFIRYVS